MHYLQTANDVRSHLKPLRDAGLTIGLVPTMGALHEGHRSLIRAAREVSDRVVVSLFVNPTQFGPGEDFERYPRPLEADLQACREEGVDLVWTPSVEDIYPSEEATRVTVHRLTDGLCGPHRPGHFEGVATVVAKLFNVVLPDVAVFGQKDAQQAAVIRRMVRDLLLPIEIRVCPIVREPDGLALSSRNVYLSPAQREQARSLSAALFAAREAVAAGQRDADSLRVMIRDRIAGAGPCTIDYVDVVDAERLEPLTTLRGRCLIAVAVRIGGTRLIDNVLVDEATGRD